MNLPYRLPGGWLVRNPVTGHAEFTTRDPYSAIDKQHPSKAITHMQRGDPYAFTSALNSFTVAAKELSKVLEATRAEIDALEARFKRNSK